MSGAGKGRTGIRRLAAETGLSVSTVSRALNGYPDVSEATRKRVQETADRLGYRANFAASVLRRNQTETITFMVSKPWTKFMDPFFLGLLDGLEMALQARGYDLQVVMAREFEAEIEIVRRVVERRRCDGLLMARTRPVDERVRYLQARGFPFATIGQSGEGGHDWIDRDHRAIGRQATAHLAALGHRRIALLYTPLRYTYSHHHREGYRQGMDEAGLDRDPMLEVECFLSQDTAATATVALLAQPDAPTAFVCGNDMIAMRAMEAAERMGLRPGRDLSFIGCDDVPLAAHLQPALTTFTQDLDAMGARLGRMILSRLDGRERPMQEYMESRLIRRDSDGPAPEPTS